MKLRPVYLLFLLGSAILVGCADSSKEDATTERLKSMAGGTLVETVPVKGTVTVDGSPAEGVNLYLFREGQYGAFVKDCRTDNEGKYCWSTNLGCDGLEPGKYMLAFTYIPKPKKNGEGVDLFKRKYQNPQKNNMSLTVASGTPQEAVNFDLKTK